MGESILSPKHEAFCRALAIPDEHGIDRSPLAAYRFAFGERCSERSASRSARRLLNRESIADRVHTLRQQADELLLKDLTLEGIGSKAKRLRRKDLHWKRLCQLIEARTAGAISVAGSETGLLRLDCKHGGNRVEVYTLDKATLDALNALEESAARELGQLGARDLSVTGEKVLVILPDNGRDRIRDIYLSEQRSTDA